MSEDPKPEERPIVQGPYTVVYVPVDHPVRDEPSPMEAQMFKARDYVDAMNQLQAFMDSDDFIADVDCRIEIFDGDLQPVTDHKAIDDMLIEAYNRECDEEDRWMGEDPRTSVPREEILVSEKQVEFIDDKKKEEKPATPDPSKEVKFSEIKIEDGR